MPKISDVSDVVAWRLCLGCGACAYICPDKKITLVDVLEEGVRPMISNNDCGGCHACLDVCPAWANDHTSQSDRQQAIPELLASCGPVLEIWEGHAGDSEIHFQGSSGGALTALSLYCLERERMAGVLHIGQDPGDPVRNATRLSRSRAELLACTGSRYAPASACDGLELIENAGGPCVFIGQPTEVSALRLAQKLKPALSQNVGLAISFFCAGAPSTKGTLDLLKKLAVPLETLRQLRYRGLGWPGMFSTAAKNEAQPTNHMTYRESWSFLQAYRPYSTHLCPDGTGEDADIACGDPWYKEPLPGEPGSSLIVIRTEIGRRILRDAIAAGYIEAKPATVQQLLDSQRNLLNKRKVIWGRILAFKLFCLPVPRLRGFKLFHNWLNLPMYEKMKSVFGTMRRIVQRRYYRPLQIRDKAYKILRSPGSNHTSTLPKQSSS